MLAENDTFMLTSELGVNMNTQCNLTGDPSAVHDINVLLASPLMQEGHKKRSITSSDACCVFLLQGINLTYE